MNRELARESVRSLCKLCELNTNSGVQLVSYGLGVDCGAAAAAASCTVDFVASGSAAELAGIRAGSKITRFDGALITRETARCYCCHST